MIVYQTDKDGILVDQMEADESPLEPGVYLIPAGCVLRVPPPCPSGMRVRWTGDDWTVEAIPMPAPAPMPMPDGNPPKEVEIMAARAALDALVAAGVISAQARAGMVP